MAQSVDHIRAMGARTFAETHIPKKSEAWKYTDVASLLAADFDHPEGNAPVPDAALLDLAGWRAVCLNGVFRPELSVLPKQDGVMVSGLSAAADERVGSLSSQDEEPVVALNQAFADDGVYISVADDTTVDGAIHILNIVTAEQPVLSQARHLFVVGARSRLSIVEHDVSKVAQRSFTNAVVEAFVGARGHLSHYRLQEKFGADHVDSTYVRQEEESTYRSWVISIGDGVVRNNVSVAVDGEYCETHLLGLSLADGNGHIDQHTLVDHLKPNCHSNELYKSILSGQAESVFRGKLFVHKDAQKTGAFQSNRNLLLSPDATANALPQLEIYADDVKCSHGATTGLLDQEALFYLRSRGIPRPVARKMLIHAFVDEIVGEITDDFARRRIEEIIDAFLDAATL